MINVNYNDNNYCNVGILLTTEILIGRVISQKQVPVLVTG